MHSLLVVPPPAQDPPSSDSLTPPVPPPSPGPSPRPSPSDGPPQAGGSTVSGLGGYEFLGVLGQGGMAVVYKARQIKAGRIVALKMILFDPPRRPDPRRFRTEPQATAPLPPPNPAPP